MYVWVFNMCVCVCVGLGNVWVGYLRVCLNCGCVYVWDFNECVCIYGLCIVWVDVCVGVCKVWVCGFRNVEVCVFAGFEMCGCVYEWVL